MKRRTIEDRLREQYFKLLPDMRRLSEQLEVKIRHCILPFSLDLDRYEQIVVKSRIKDCESAIDKLRRKKQEGATFDQSKNYSLLDLKDLVGIRILVFPKRRIPAIKKALLKLFPSWEADHVYAEQGRSKAQGKGKPLALKYSGKYKGTRIMGEYQIVPMLTGLFWEVEHAAIYKPLPALKGAARNPDILKCKQDILEAFRAFEQELQDQICVTRRVRKKS